MTRTELTTVETVEDEGSWLFTAGDAFDSAEEVLIVPCSDGPRVRAWVNRCTHESQRLDRGMGAVIRDDGIVCPKHGSMFDTCSGHCDNGEAADTTLPEVEVTVEEGSIYLTDDHYTFRHEGPIEDDDGPDSTSHIGF